jgi:hypothetical protein
MDSTRASINVSDDRWFFIHKNLRKLKLRLAANRPENFLFLGADNESDTRIKCSVFFLILLPESISIIDYVVGLRASKRDMAL